jgi:NDP-sugar pyrophosphorylase family protein
MIVFPMAGLSKRFFDAGYEVPKFMLDVHGNSLFWHVMKGFEKYFEHEDFLFVTRNIEGVERFITAECKKLLLNRFDVVILDHETLGQAETVYLGLKYSKLKSEQPLLIFNIDTIRKNFTYPDFLSSGVDGYLEVFEGAGPNWSYVKPRVGTNLVELTTEKVPVSNLCCTGIYYFSSSTIFSDYFEGYRNLASSKYGVKELYVAPMYNLMIEAGLDVRFDLILVDQVVFSGTPDEYDQAVKTLQK